jgi:hypothetical protein
MGREREPKNKQNRAMMCMNVHFDQNVEVNGQSITGIANILIIILRSFLHLFMTLID